MKYTAAAFDYDGTLATNGSVSAEVIHALRKLKDEGCKLILVTGRIWSDLRQVFPAVLVFDAVIAENGCCLYDPRSNEETLLCETVPPLLVQSLKGLQVKPLNVGRCHVATITEFAPICRDVIEKLQIEFEPIFNKESVMVLPTGVDKGTGLRAALERFQFDDDEELAIAAFGDAENDVVLLEGASLRVAVRDSVPELLDVANVIAPYSNGDGVCAVIQNMLEGVFDEF